MMAASDKPSWEERLADHVQQAEDRRAAGRWSEAGPRSPVSHWHQAAEALDAGLGLPDNPPHELPTKTLRKLSKKYLDQYPTGQGWPSFQALHAWYRSDTDEIIRRLVSVDLARVTLLATVTSFGSLDDGHGAWYVPSWT